MDKLYHPGIALAPLLHSLTQPLCPVPTLPFSIIYTTTRGFPDRVAPGKLQHHLTFSYPFLPFVAIP